MKLIIEIDDAEWERVKSESEAMRIYGVSVSTDRCYKLVMESIRAARPFSKAALADEFEGQWKKNRLVISGAPDYHTSIVYDLEMEDRSAMNMTLSQWREE